VEFVLSPVNIVKVCSGQHHYVALAQDFSVYTWGMGGEQLGHGELNDGSHLSQPQLVETLLSSNGGGRVVDISAAGNRSCAITDVGELFTWGATCRQGVLTPGPSNYQPVPKKVPGVKQAIAVSAGEDHTLVLTGTTLPKLPLHNLYDSFISRSPIATDNADAISRSVKKKDDIPLHLKRRNSRSNSVFDDLTDIDPEDEGEGDVEVDQVDDDHPLHMDNNHAAYSSNVDEDSKMLFGLDSSKAASRKSNERDRNMIPTVIIPSLMCICEREVAKSITTRTVISALMFSEQYSANVLADYCSAFIKMNFDGVLAVMKPSDIESYVQEMQYTVNGSTSVMERKCSDASLSVPVSTRSSKDNHKGSSSISPSQSSCTHTPVLSRSTKKTSSTSPIDLQSMSAKSRDSSSSGSKTKNESSSKVHESSSDVLKSMKMVRKKLNTITELVDKLQNDAGFKITKEQEEKVSKKRALQLEYAHLEQLLVRYRVTEKNREVCQTPTDVMDDLLEEVACAEDHAVTVGSDVQSTVGLKACDNDKHDAGIKEEAPPAAADRVGAPMNYSVWKNLFNGGSKNRNSDSNSVIVEGSCVSTPIDSSGVKNVCYDDDISSKASYKSIHPLATNMKHITVNNITQGTISNASSVSNTHRKEASSRAIEEDPFFEIKKGRKKVSDAPSLSSPHTTTPVCLSSATASGRTVLSPPSLVKQSSVTPTAAVTVINNTSADTVANSDNAISSRNQFSLAQFIAISPKKASSSSSSSSSKVPSAAINSAIDSRSIDSKTSPVISSPPPLKAWNIVSPTVSTPLLVASKPMKSLLEIQEEEEWTRKQSNVMNLKGHENKWFVERRIRTDSIEFVMKQQEIERQEELELQRALKQVDDMKSKERVNRQGRQGKKKSTASQQTTKK